MQMAAARKQYLAHPKGQLNLIGTIMIIEQSKTYMMMSKLLQQLRKGGITRCHSIVYSFANLTS